MKLRSQMTWWPECRTHSVGRAQRSLRTPSLCSGAAAVLTSGQAASGTQNVPSNALAATCTPAPGMAFGLTENFLPSAVCVTGTVNHTNVWSHKYKCASMVEYRRLQGGRGPTGATRGAVAAAGRRPDAADARPRGPLLQRRAHAPAGVRP